MNESEILLPIPMKFRRGAYRKDQAASLKTALDLLDWVGNIKPIQNSRILDFGCGVKMTQALIQRNSPQRLYAGLDVYGAMIQFLVEALKSDPRYQFYKVPFQNDKYNPDGEVMSRDSVLPFNDETFDIMLLFSVITHMKPQDTAATFAILRKYADADTSLMFWAFADADQDANFEDHNPEKPLLRALYNRGFLESLVVSNGWQIDHSEPFDTRFKKVRYVCSPSA